MMDKKENFTTLLFKILPALSAPALVIAIAVFLYRAIFSSGYFNIDYTKLIWHDNLKVAFSPEYNKLSDIGKGENIFKLNIGTVASKIISDHPEFKDCTIERRFPDTLVIDIYVRQPVAQIDCGRFYLVDQDAILLSKARVSTLEGLPLVTGVNWKPSRKIGQRYQSPRVFKALKLLSAINESDILESHSLLRIDVSDHRNLVFFIDDSLQVKIGRDHFQERLDLLKETLSSSYINKNDLEYIDLRFDDIVFGAR